MQMNKQLIRQLRVLITVSAFSLIVVFPVISQSTQAAPYPTQDYVHPNDYWIQDFANAVWDWAKNQAYHPQGRIKKICERIRDLIDTADGISPQGGGIHHYILIWVPFPPYWLLVPVPWPSCPTPHPEGNSWGDQWITDTHQLDVGRWRSLYGGYGDAKFYGQTLETGANCWVNFALLMGVLQALHNQGKFSIYDIKGCYGQAELQPTGVGHHYWVKGYVYVVTVKIYFFASFDSDQYQNGEWDYADFFYDDPQPNTGVYFGDFEFQEENSIAHLLTDGSPRTTT
ncbi:MAG: hypothetical protein ACFFCF_11780 [Promethearchaeota archaeon]